MNIDMNLRYRSDIDGLRALAVLLVFAYHLKLSMISGGFLVIAGGIFLANRMIGFMGERIARYVHF